MLHIPQGFIDTELTDGTIKPGNGELKSILVLFNLYDQFVVLDQGMTNSPDGSVSWQENYMRRTYKEKKTVRFYFIITLLNCHFKISFIANIK